MRCVPGREGYLSKQGTSAAHADAFLQSAESHHMLNSDSCQGECLHRLLQARLPSECLLQLMSAAAVYSHRVGQTGYTLTIKLPADGGAAADGNGGVCACLSHCLLLTPARHEVSCISQGGRDMLMHGRTAHISGKPLCPMQHTFYKAMQ